MSEVFGGIIGHERITSVLAKMLSNNSLPHAFLFVGSEGVGRTHLTESLLRAIFETNSSLHTILDLLWVRRLVDQKTEKPKTQISVDQIRELTTRLSMSAMGGGWKAGIIEEADRLSRGAANALLKTLEEPKGKTMLVLRAPSVESVLETIASRCQIVRFYPVSEETIISSLVKQGFSKVDATAAAHTSLGCPGRAIRFMKDGEYRAQYETGRTHMLQALSGSIPDRLRAATEMIPKSEIDKRSALDHALDRAEEILREQLFHSNQEQTIHALDRLYEVRASIKYNINPHLALEYLFL